MTEREIRRVIVEVCAELDRRARGLLFPMLGAGVALAVAGCGDDSKPAPNPDATYMGPDIYVPRDAALYGIDAIYMAPDAGVKLDGLLNKDLPPVPPYMAPDVGKPKLEAGSSTLYSVPPPDLK
jgi:hypothetical protein